MTRLTILRRTAGLGALVALLCVGSAFTPFPEVAKASAQSPDATADSTDTAGRTTEDASSDQQRADLRRKQNAKLWKQLSPEDRKRYRSMHRHLRKMNKEQRKDFLTRFRSLSPEERDQLRKKLRRFSRAPRSERDKLRHRHRELRRWARFLPESTLDSLHGLPKEERIRKIREGFHVLREEHQASMSAEQQAAFNQLDRRERGKQLEAFLAERYPERKARCSPLRGKRHFRGPGGRRHGPPPPGRGHSEMRELRKLLLSLPPEEAKEILADPDRAAPQPGFTAELIQKLKELPPERRERLLLKRRGGRPEARPPGEGPRSKRGRPERDRRERRRPRPEPSGSGQD